MSIRKEALFGSVWRIASWVAGMGGGAWRTVSLTIWTHRHLQCSVTRRRLVDGAGDSAPPKEIWSAKYIADGLVCDDRTDLDVWWRDILGADEKLLESLLIV